MRRRIVIIGIIISAIGIFLAYTGSMNVQYYQQKERQSLYLSDYSQEIESFGLRNAFGVLITFIGIPLTLVGAVLKDHKNNDDKNFQIKENESPLDTLKSRYAKGEITKEEYEQMKKDIEGEDE